MDTQPLFTSSEGGFFEEDNTQTTRVRIKLDVGSKGYCSLVLKSRNPEDGERLALLLNEAIEEILFQPAMFSN